MKVVPIGFVLPLIRQVRAGTLVQSRRPSGLFDALEPGDRLWVREPFHLEERFDHISPSQALILAPDQRLAFAADDPVGPIGRRRFARELPRARHRSHLVVLAVRHESLQDLTDQDARLEGSADREAFALSWDALHAAGKYSINGSRIRWADNPRVTVIRFRFVDAPLEARAA